VKTICNRNLRFKEAEGMSRNLGRKEAEDNLQQEPEKEAGGMSRNLGRKEAEKKP
jgi:hypothetical protein